MQNDIQSVIKGHGNYLLQAIAENEQEDISYHIDSLSKIDTKEALKELVSVYKDHFPERAIPRPNQHLVKAIFAEHFNVKANISVFAGFAQVAKGGDRFDALMRLSEFDSCRAKGALDVLINMFAGGILGRIREGDEAFASSTTVANIIDNGKLNCFMPTQTVEDARIVFKAFYQQTLSLLSQDELTKEDVSFANNLLQELRVDGSLESSNTVRNTWAIPCDIDALSRLEFIELVELPSILAICCLLRLNENSTNVSVREKEELNRVINRTINRFSRYHSLKLRSSLPLGNTTFKLVNLLKSAGVETFLAQEPNSFSAQWNELINALEVLDTRDNSPYLMNDESFTFVVNNTLVST